MGPERGTKGRRDFWTAGGLEGSWGEWPPGKAVLTSRVRRSMSDMANSLAFLLQRDETLPKHLLQMFTLHLSSPWLQDDKPRKQSKEFAVDKKEAVGGGLLSCWLQRPESRLQELNALSVQPLIHIQPLHSLQKQNIRGLEPLRAQMGLLYLNQETLLCQIQSTPSLQHLIYETPASFTLSRFIWVNSENPWQDMVEKWLV